MPIVDPGKPSADGRPEVDVTLIDEMLRLSPEERLRQNDRSLTLAAQLREAFSEAFSASAGSDGQPR